MKEKYQIIKESNDQVTIPANETWLYKNKEAFDAVKIGLEESTSRKIKKRGNFSKYIEE